MPRPGCICSPRITAHTAGRKIQGSRSIECLRDHELAKSKVCGGAEVSNMRDMHGVLRVVGAGFAFGVRHDEDDGAVCWAARGRLTKGEGKGKRWEAKKRKKAR